MYRPLLTLSWFAGTIYATIPLFSLVVRPLAKLLRARVHSPSQVMIPSWFIMMGVIYFMTWPWREAVLYRAPRAWLASVLLFGAAIVIYHRSRLSFSHVSLVGHWTRPSPGTAACHFRDSSTSPASHLPRASVHAACLDSGLWWNCAVRPQYLRAVDGLADDSAGRGRTGKSFW